MLKHRERFYYTIIMPLDADGNGPASEGEIHKITFEVWDQYTNVMGSYDYLADALDKADELNLQYHGAELLHESI